MGPAGQGEQGGPDPAPDPRELASRGCREHSMAQKELCSEVGGGVGATLTMSLTPVFLQRDAWASPHSAAWGGVPFRPPFPFSPQVVGGLPASPGWLHYGAGQREGGRPLLPAGSCSPESSGRSPGGPRSLGTSHF